jgi:hypothetical protein
MANTPGVDGVDWVLAASSGIPEAINVLVTSALDARDQVLALETQFSSDLATLQALIASISSFGVASVKWAGTAVQTGPVVINPVIADISGLQAALDAKAAITYVNTAVATKQASSSKLDALSALTWSADLLPYFTGASAVGTVPTTSYSRGLLNGADQAAWKTALGITGSTFATDAEIRAATGGNAIKSSSLASASALVGLTDAATVAVDWATGINFSLAVTANRVIGNPTNGIQGTTRTILVQATSGARSITFGNNYLGDLPTITDVSTSVWYLLTIYCVTTTHFTVSSKRAR